MNSKERVIMALNLKEPDLIPIHDSLWPSTVKRWEQEGLPQNTNVRDFFGYDMVWIQPDYTPQYSYKLIKENRNYIIERNRFGELIKNYNDYSTTPQIIDSMVKDKKDWEKLKERLVINNSRFISFNNILDPKPNAVLSWDKTLKNFNEDKKKGRAICFQLLTGFDMIQRYLGTEKLLIAMIEEPDWAKEMFMTHAEFVIELYKLLVENGLRFDVVLTANDMAYRNTTLFSPKCYKELIFPADRLICEFFHSLSIPIILHSDGNIRGFIPYLIEAGFDCIQPLEVKAGMDIISLKKEYGDRLCFMGGIDTRLMSDNDPTKIEEEIKIKFEIAKKSGGYIYHSDHSIPDNISFSQYKHVMQVVRKYAKY